MGLLRKLSYPIRAPTGALTKAFTHSKASPESTDTGEESNQLTTLDLGEFSFGLKAFKVSSGIDHLFGSGMA